MTQKENLPIQLKRTGDNLNCWYPYPPTEKYLYNIGRPAVYEGDEIVDGTPYFQVCQKCLTTIPERGLKNVCPECGFDIDKDFEQLILERHIENLKREAVQTHINLFNLLYHFVNKPSMDEIQQLKFTIVCI
jgi:hypothetical protein